MELPISTWCCGVLLWVMQSTSSSMLCLVVNQVALWHLISNHLQASDKNASVWQDDAVPDPVRTALPTWNRGHTVCSLHVNQQPWFNIRFIPGVCSGISFEPHHRAVWQSCSRFGSTDDLYSPTDWVPISDSKGSHRTNIIGWGVRDWPYLFCSCLKVMVCAWTSNSWLKPHMLQLCTRVRGIYAS